MVLNVNDDNEAQIKVNKKTFIQYLHIFCSLDDTKNYREEANTLFQTASKSVQIILTIAEYRNE